MTDEPTGANAPDTAPLGDAPTKPTRKQRATDKRRAACMAAVRPVDFARAFGAPPKSVRNTLRDKVGVYVSRGDAFDAKAKARLYAILTKGEGSNK